MARDDGLGMSQAAQMRGAGVNAALSSVAAGLTNLLAQQEMRRQQALAMQQRKEDQAIAAQRFATETGLQREGLGLQREGLGLQREGLGIQRDTAAAAAARAYEDKDVEAARIGKRLVREMVPLGGIFRPRAPEPTMTKAPASSPYPEAQMPQMKTAAQRFADKLPAGPDLRMLVPKGFGAARRLERDPDYVSPEEAKARAERESQERARYDDSYKEMRQEYHAAIRNSVGADSDIGKLLLQSEALAEAGDEAAAERVLDAVRMSDRRFKVGGAVTSLLSMFKSGAHNWHPQAVERFERFLRTVAKQTGVEVPDLDDPLSGFTEEQLLQYRQEVEAKRKAQADQAAKEQTEKATAADIRRRLTGPPRPDAPTINIGQAAPAAPPTTASGVPLEKVDLAQRSYVLRPENAEGLRRALSLLRDPEDIAAFEQMITSATRGETPEEHQRILDLQNAPPYRSQEELRAAKAAGTQKNPVAGRGFSRHVSGAALDIDPRIFERAHRGDIQALRILGALEEAGWYRDKPTGDPPHWVLRE